MVASLFFPLFRYKFLVHPAGFLVHRQHSRSHADKMYQHQKKDYEVRLKETRLRGLLRSKHDTPAQHNLAVLTHKFRDQVQADLQAGTYKPVLDDGIRKCVETLPWWEP
jgi:hypothetical protein